MDLRREKRKENRILGLLVTAAALCAAVLAALLMSYFSGGEEDFSRLEGIDSRAEPAPAGIASVFAKKNDAKSLSYEIKRELVFEKSGGEAQLLFKNPTNNRYLVRLEITVEGEPVLSAGALAPGQVIKEAALNAELPPGEYGASAVITAIDPESGEPAGQVTQQVAIIIKG